MNSKNSTISTNTTAGQNALPFAPSLHVTETASSSSSSVTAVTLFREKQVDDDRSSSRNRNLDNFSIVSSPATATTATLLKKNGESVAPPVATASDDVFSDILELTKTAPTSSRIGNIAPPPPSTMRSANVKKQSFRPSDQKPKGKDKTKRRHVYSVPHFSKKPKKPCLLKNSVSEDGSDGPPPSPFRHPVRFDKNSKDIVFHEFDSVVSLPTKVNIMPLMPWPERIGQHVREVIGPTHLAWIIRLQKKFDQLVKTRQAEAMRYREERDIRHQQVLYYRQKCNTLEEERDALLFELQRRCNR